jgi:dihydropteroate synthase
VIGPTIFPLDRVTVVAVLNVTPDSFSDGGRFVRAGSTDVEAAVAEGLRLLAEGADVLDVGGESTRPGAAPVAAGEERARVVPVIEALAKATCAPLCVDTRKAEVAEAALDAGARLVNDVSGLVHDPGLARVVARGGAGLVLGHLRGTPATMQEEVHFDDVLAEVVAELAASVARAREAGVEGLAVDPGLGFGKGLPHNLALLARVGELRERLGLPVMVGPSRKAFLGALTGDPVERREEATLAACAVAVFAGADALRVHVPGAALRAARVARALREARA